MSNHEFQTADHIFPHDRLMAKTVLKLIPRKLKPNHFTVFRFIATPFVVLLIFNGNYILGLIAFMLVSFTDAIDGSLARTRDQITEWGKIYDPVADKILIGSMVFVIILKYIDLWTSILIIALEIIIVIVAWVRLKIGKKVQANIWGKIKMCLQVLGVSILLLSVVLDWAQLIPLASGALYLAIAFAVVSLLSYGI